MSDAETAVEVSASERVEQLLAESEALLASINGASSPLSTGSPLSSGAVSPDDDRVTQPTANSVSTTKRTRNSTRDRIQSELQFLRQHVDELEAEIDAKEKKKKEKEELVQRDSDLSSGVLPTSVSTTLESLPAVSTWQRLEQRQRRARALSAKENRKLRGRVAEHAKIIQGIRELLLVYQRAGDWHQSYRDHLNNMVLCSGWEEAAEFARLKRDTARAFAGLHSVVLAETTNTSTNEATESLSREENVFSHTYDEQTQRFVSRLASSRVFPFDLHGTSNATWRAIFTLFGWRELLAGDNTTGVGKVSIAAQSGLQVIEHSDDTYAVKYAATLRLGTAQVIVNVKDVVARYAFDGTPDKTVVVWETSLSTGNRYDADSAAAAPGQAPPQIRGSGWVVLHKQLGASSSSTMRSVFEFSTQRAPVDDSAKLESKVQLMKAWVTLGESCMDGISLEVDKSLL